MCMQRESETLQVYPKMVDVVIIISASL